MYAYVKHGIRVQYAAISTTVYGSLQYLTKTWSA